MTNTARTRFVAENFEMYLAGTTDDSLLTFDA